MRAERPLRILIANVWLIDRTGTEVLVRDLALNFLRRGHSPAVYALRLGEPAEELRDLGVSVVDNVAQVTETPDIVHGTHNVPTAMALARFPDCPAVWVCQDWRWWYDRPPRLSRIAQYVAIDQPRRDYLVRELGIAAERVTVLYNAVDLARVPPRPAPLPDRPRHALAFTKTAEQLDALRQACDRTGLEFAALGRGPGTRVADPERHLVRYDVVFATGRCAIEALCAGCAVIVGDARGFAGLVTMANYDFLRDRNFGSEAFTEDFTTDAAAREIVRYERTDAEAVAHKTRELADLEPALDRLEELYRRAMASARARKGWTAKDRRVLREFVQNWPPREQSPEWRFDEERERLQKLSAELDRSVNGLRRWYLAARDIWR